MEIFDQLNLYLHTHPIALEQLAFAFKVKYLILLALALYFILLPARHRKKDMAKMKADENHFEA